MTMTYEQRVSRMDQITSELGQLAEHERLTRAQEALVENLRAEFHGLGYERIASAARGEGGGRTEAGTRPAEHPGGEDRPRRSEVRGRALDLIESMTRVDPVSAATVTDDALERAAKWVENDRDPFDGAARWVSAAGDPAYRSAFTKLARDPVLGGHVLTPPEREAVLAAQSYCRAMSLTPSGGGYLVPFQLDPTVIVTADLSTNPVRRLARKVVATGNKWNGVSSGAVSWSWDAEATEVSDDATTFAQPGVDIFMARGFVPISIEANEDEANVATNIVGLLAAGRDVLESASFTVGTGVGQPLGVVTALTGTASELPSATADTFAAADLYSMDNALPSRFSTSPSAAWIGNKSILNRARQMVKGSGLSESIVDDAGAVPRVLNKPYYESSDMAGTITAAAANRILVLGDFSQMIIADRLGLTVEFVPHLFGTTTGRPKGQRGWFAFYRTGSSVPVTGGFRLLNA